MGDGGGVSDTTRSDNDVRYDFFVSYTGADAAWAQWIAWQLEARVRFSERPARVFVQAWDLVPGTNWATSMHLALPVSARVVPVLSPTYLKDSRYGNAEWLAIWPDDPEGLKRRIVPVVVAQCKPTGLLATINSINLVGRDEAAASDTLLAGITASVKGRAKPTVAPQFPGPDGRATHGAGQPNFPGPVSAVTVPAAAVSAAVSATTAITVLHISDTQFGAHHVFGRAGLTEADRARSSLFGRLHDDLRDRAEFDGLRPDLVVITGDLTETGAKGEFDQAYDFLIALAESLKLDRNRFVLIPGNHDVNRLLCQAYFLQCEAADETPLPPYWPKWGFFDTLLGRFYGTNAVIGFAVGAEWSLIEIPDHKVVVAGLNSTMAETHEEHYGWLGEHQLHTVADGLRRYERDGWLRIGAVHHNPIRSATSDDENLRDADDLDRILGPHLNLLLHGHTDDGRVSWLPSSGLPVASTGSAAVDAQARLPEILNQYQLLRIDRDSFTRWTGDLRIDPAGNSRSIRTPHTFHSVHAAFPTSPGDNGDISDQPPLPPDTLDEIAEVARLRHPDATVKRIDASGERPAHLRVRRAEGKVVEQRVIGLVEGTVDAAAVDEFATTVRAPYLAAFPGLFTDLVHTGATPATPELVADAERLGVRLLSMLEYQGVLDLRGYVDRQTARLRADADYPPELYVPQHIRRIDRTTGSGTGTAPATGPALEQIVEWLTTDEARFILVLGDSGHGKTFLAHELALALPRHLPHVDPMLIELRQLEKSIELDRLIAQHLVDSQVRRPDLDAFRYMLAQGRLVLIFDGFDELATRVTYQRAVARLGTLLAALDNRADPDSRAAATSRAKIVVTSRAEFFLTDDDVLTVTGERVERTLGRFIVRLAEFTPEQIDDFLVGRFTRALSTAFPDTDARRVEAEQRATARLDLIQHVRDLPDLARNPRLLSFIADLEEDRLRAARQRGGTVTAADLYRELLGQWLVYECDRSPEMTVEERNAAVTELAVTLWRDGVAFIDLARLTEIAAGVLQSMRDPRGLTPAETALLLGSGTALRRDADGRFSFIHRSVMEYLVAADIARRLTAPTGHAGHAGHADDLLAAREMSELMADFFADLADRTEAARWAQNTVDDPNAPAVAKANALVVARRLNIPLRTGAKFAGTDLAGHDLAGRDLRDADLRRANLTDARLDHADLRGADLRGAILTGASLAGTALSGADLTGTKLTGATVRDVSAERVMARKAALDGIQIIGGMLPGLDLAGASMKQARVTGTELTGADLTRADLHGARFVDTDLTGAVLTESRWSRAAVLGGRLGAARDAPELAAAAVAGRDPAQAMLRSPASPENAVAFSPDGTMIASGGDDRTVRLWDTATGQQIRTLTGHTGRVRSVGFSPDGTMIVSGSSDHKIRLWNTATGGELHTLTGHTGRVRSVGFSPDGAMIASGSDDGRVRLWDTATGQQIAEMTGHGSPVWSVSFSPNDTMLASGGDDRTVRLWDTATGGELRTLIGIGSPVWSVAFSPDSTMIASGSDDGKVRLWNTATGQLLHTLTGLTNPKVVGSIWDDTEPDGQRFAPTARTKPVRAVGFSPDGTMIASGSDDHMVRLWNTATGQQIRTLTGHTSPVWSVAFSPDGTMIASGSEDHTVRLWDTTANQQIRILTGHSDRVWSVGFSPDGTMLTTGSGDRAVRLCDTTTGHQTALMIAPTKRLWSMAFSPDGTMIASGGDDGKIRLWDTATGQQIRTLPGQASRVWSVRFSPDGAMIASGSSDHKVRLWDTATNQLIAEMTGHTDRVWSVRFSPDGTMIASGSDDHTVRLWNTATGRQIRILPGHTSPVWSVGFSPDGTMIASGGDDRTVRLWNTATGQQIHTLTGHTSPVWSVAFSPDGTMIASGSSDRTVRLSDTTTGAELRTLTGHTSTVRSVEFSPDCTMIASGSDDATVRLWDTATGRSIATLIGVRDGWALLLPDGSYKLVGEPDGSFWWVIGNVRFEPGELDGYDPTVRRVPADAPLVLPGG
ncbi:pentapeptide repeat-containing protein [Frankia sp. Cr2]|uniref:pentapeptide repeat-containing protein n=1 Tax=Frankia sp. Cr2 TaxID=3073932 RepID=UPI002AD4EB1F|nr:pentapeptide repeat-containing protein [Frankia sp. Cr2]